MASLRLSPPSFSRVLCTQNTAIGPCQQNGVDTKGAKRNSSIWIYRCYLRNTTAAIPAYVIRQTIGQCTSQSTVDMTNLRKAMIVAAARTDLPNSSAALKGGFRRKRAIRMLVLSRYC